ncbi:MAG: three-Cys-motif partner protein TcmP [Pirellulales bacterium]
MREAGAWTEDKLWVWNRYIEITTSAMVGNPKWKGGLAYVDLFGGSGVCKVAGRRIPGSILLAAMAPKQFSKIIVCEKKRSLANACEQRLTHFGAAGVSNVLIGDCNRLIDDVVACIPSQSLSLAFIDPEGLHAEFNTVAKLTSGRQADLLILFGDKMDIARNVDLYAGQKESKLDRFMGLDCPWRNEWLALNSQDADLVCQLFVKLYKAQLETKLGYKAFADQVMRSSKSAIYRVIFATKHPRGEEFWKKISKIDRQGQRSLFD